MTLRTIGPFWLACVLGVPGCGGAPEDERKTDAAKDCASQVEPAAGFLPCDVEAVLEAKCQRCHNTTEVRRACSADGTCEPAPFPLLEWADTHRLLGDTPIYVRMGDAVESGFMPFKSTRITPSVEPLTDPEKKTLLDWIADCAPSASSACP